MKESISDDRPTINVAPDRPVEWDPQLNTFFYFDSDSIKYEWDLVREGWFTSTDQSKFDLIQSQLKSQQNISKEEPKEGENKVKKASTSHQRKNTSIYVSGLPLDTSTDEVYEYFSKCGIIMESIHEAGCPRIKLYQHENGELKGDALITFLMEESVDLAVTLLDDTEFRSESTLAKTPNFNIQRIHVQPAAFQPRNQQQEELENIEKKKRMQKSLLKQSFDRMKRKLDWNDGLTPQKSTHSIHSVEQEEENVKMKFAQGKVVLLKHMFNRNELLKDPSIAFDIKDDLRDECNAFGKITNIKLYENYEDGFITIKFKDPLSAACCIETFNGRWYDGMKIEASYYDGSLRKANLQQLCDTNDEEEEEEEERLENFSQWIENEQEKE